MNTAEQVGVWTVFVLVTVVYPWVLFKALRGLRSQIQDLSRQIGKEKPPVPEAVPSPLPEPVGTRLPPASPSAPARCWCRFWV
ncbi:MAG: hypothetical protein ACO3N7_10880 [Kiritimatiellia bacterium]